MIDFINAEISQWADSYDGPLFHALLADPPAGIAFMNKHWDKDHGGRDQWIEAMATIFKGCVKHMHPGAHAIVWALPRTSHWTATALENAGLEVRDIITHVFGSGFPKSENIGKRIDKKAGAEREVIGAKRLNERDKKTYIPAAGGGYNGVQSAPSAGMNITAPATEDAAACEGWGTALKPASEHWIIARKPIKGTIADNCLANGAGALNIDGCRIGTGDGLARLNQVGENGWKNSSGGPNAAALRAAEGLPALGRWPANFTLQHSPHCNGVCVEDCPVKLLGEQSGELDNHRKKAGMNKVGGKGQFSGQLYGTEKGRKKETPKNFLDTGTAARFFQQSDWALEQAETIELAELFYYVAKASRSERDAGLEDMPLHNGMGLDVLNAGGTAGIGNHNPVCQTCGGSKIDRGNGQCVCESPDWKAVNNKTHNPHPTVKPLKLTKYLASLLLIPDLYTPRRILCPFGGSGSEAIGAMLAGWDEITYIEREAEYLPIAQKRAAYWQSKQIDAQPKLLEAA